MAISITLTLGAGLGADLGPNFDLTANVGTVTPSTATKSELTTGKSVSVDDAASQVTVTSTGTCTNAITQTIPCATTTTTTTTAAPVCDQYEIQNFTESAIGISYYDCNGNYTATSIGSGNNLLFCSDVAYGAIDAGGGTLSNVGDCTGGTTTTTTAAPPTLFCDCGGGCEEYAGFICPPGCSPCAPL
jgi:hypothetical protein